jgi:cyclase
MDAKWVIPALTLSCGRVDVPDGTDPSRLLDPARPAPWAWILEREGADGILFREGSPGEPGARCGWIRAVAAALGVPMALEARFQAWADLAAILEAGADRVFLAPSGALEDPLLVTAVGTFGRDRVGVALDVRLEGEGRWRVGEGPVARDALEWMDELEQRGAGALLVRAEPEGAAPALFQAAARLSLTVLFQTAAAPSLAAEALLHGADGVVYPAQACPAHQGKAALASHGLAVRQPWPSAMA